MKVDWYLNHSKSLNAYHKNYEYYVIKDIKKDEKIAIDYNIFEKPKENK